MHTPILSSILAANGFTTDDLKVSDFIPLTEELLRQSYLDEDENLIDHDMEIRSACDFTEAALDKLMNIPILRFTGKLKLSPHQTADMQKTKVEADILQALERVTRELKRHLVWNETPGNRKCASDTILDGWRCAVSNAEAAISAARRMQTK